MGVPATAVMDTTPVGLAEAIAIEAAEARAWADMYGAAPAEFARAAGVETRDVAGALVLRWAATGRRYFSRAIGLGVAQPATPAALDEILGWYEETGVTMFLLQSLPHCRPAQYEDWLRERGLEPFDAQDRIVRGGEPFDVAAAAGPAGRELTVERVERGAVEEWASFLADTYGLDTGDWLEALHARPGWHQYVAREAGVIVSARGMFIDPGGTAWLGMDGPVPGVHAPEYDGDAALCAAIVADGLRRGARSFIADIEAPSADMSTPAYDYFGRLGFRRPYVRTHWARVAGG
ncbi:MAG TPA: hypothetical protein VGI67_01545 [Thermoleophilaceae bacterium]|jgi:hypothetical protein